MVNVFTTSGACMLKAGKYLSPDFSGARGEPNWSGAMAQAEAHICAETTYNWVDNYPNLNPDVRYILDEAASNLAAMYGINYDMSGYTSRAEAQSMLDVLWNNYQACIKILKEKDKQTFMKNA